MKEKYIIGIDEVGRGPLAGPVVVAAVVVPKGMRFSIRDARSGKKIGTLKDSKKLSRRQREAWSAYFKNHPSVQFALSRVRPGTIDRINISCAANLAALRAFNRLMVKSQLSKVNCAVYLDGGLYLRKRKWQKVNSKLQIAKTIIRGDEKINAVKIASIIAKCHRDRFMTRLGRKYPEYGFSFHKGYGTKAHIAAIKRHGVSGVHRKSFCGKLGR